MVYKIGRLALSVREVSVLKRLCTGGHAVGKLAQQEGISPGFASQLVKSLKTKNLVSENLNGTERLVQLSGASHARAFKRLVDSRPQAKVEEWLSGNSLEILILTALGDGMDMPVLALESRLSVPTAYRVVKRLQAAGVVVRLDGRVKVSDSVVGAFASSFADNAFFQLQEGFRGHNLGIRVRKHAVLRSDSPTIPDFATETGLNALVQAGLEAVLTSYRDYYFNLDGVKRKLSLEENFIHALMLSTLQQHQDETVLGMFLAKNGRRLDRTVLKRLAQEYSVDSKLIEVLNSLRAAVDLANKLNQ